MTLRSTFQSLGNRSRFGIHALVVGLGLLAGFVGTSGLGCGGALGGECLVPSDCSDGLVCAYQYCHQECAASRDCSTEGDLCFKEDKGSDGPGYCDQPTACATTGDCNKDFAKGQACREGTCRDTCETDAQCTVDQRCFAHVCYQSCEKDSDCGQGLCFDHKCAKSKPLDVPGELGMPCAIHSDCKSGNCIDKTCVGCRKDSDCPGQGRCDGPDPTDPGKGTCVDGECPAADPASPIKIDTGKYLVDDAAPNQNGDTIYFVGHDSTEPYSPGVFMISAGGGSVTQLCFDKPQLEPFYGISISSDDKTLYLLGDTNDPAVFSLKNDSPCGKLSRKVENPGSYYRGLIDVHKNGADDVIYFARAADETGVLGMSSRTVNSEGSIVDPLSSFFAPIEATGAWTPTGLAVGRNQAVFVATSAFQLVASEDNSIGLIKENLGVFDAGVALNVAEDTVYAFGYDTFSGQGRVLAIKSSSGACAQQYSTEIATTKTGTNGIYSILRRARNTDIFSWTTPLGELYLFKP